MKKIFFFIFAILFSIGCETANNGFQSGNTSQTVVPSNGPQIIVTETTLPGYKKKTNSTVVTTQGKKTEPKQQKYHGNFQPEDNKLAKVRTTFDATTFTDKDGQKRKFVTVFPDANTNMDDLLGMMTWGPSGRGVQIHRKAKKLEGADPGIPGDPRDMYLIEWDDRSFADQQNFGNLVFEKDEKHYWLGLTPEWIEGGGISGPTDGRVTFGTSYGDSGEIEGMCIVIKEFPVDPVLNAMIQKALNGSQAVVEEIKPVDVEEIQVDIE